MVRVLPGAVRHGRAQLDLLPASHRDRRRGMGGRCETELHVRAQARRVRITSHEAPRRCVVAAEPPRQGIAPRSSPRPPRRRARPTSSTPSPRSSSAGPRSPGDAAPSGGKSKWTQGGDAIDTKEFDTAIATAEAAAKSKPNDDAAKKALSNAYFMRAEALKDARQYASALGDYRRALKNDPSNAQAKNWIEQIIMIYDSLGRESPPEGQEPPPLGKKS